MDPGDSIYYNLFSCAIAFTCLWVHEEEVEELLDAVDGLAIDLQLGQLLLQVRLQQQSLDHLQHLAPSDLLQIAWNRHNAGGVMEVF
jgi:hypothetical protein